MIMRSPAQGWGLLHVQQEQQQEQQQEHEQRERRAVGGE